MTNTYEELQLIKRTAWVNANREPRGCTEEEADRMTPYVVNAVVFTAVLNGLLYDFEDALKADRTMNDTYLLFGLMAEVGELADKVAKAKRKEIITIEDSEIFPVTKDGTMPLLFEEFTHGFAKELGDVLWFVALIAKHAGLTLDEVAQMNLDKLADRAKRGKIIGEGDDR